MNGFINLFKPSGITSFDAISRVRRLLPRKTKIGHAGTLDPLAEGVLVTAIGSATRLIEYAQNGEKTYRSEFLLGRYSDTEDTEGTVVELENPVIPTRDQLLESARHWTGTILQQPPVYSALKINGRRACDLAREGKDVELKPRSITIYRAELLDYDYPRMNWEIVCSAGSYVRSWGRDVAQTAGSAAVMSGLIRTKVGKFDLSTAVRPEILTADNLASYLRPVNEGCPNMAAIVLTDAQLADFRLGRFLKPDFEIPDSSTNGPWLALDSQNCLRAIIILRGDGWVQAIKNLD